MMVGVVADQVAGGDDAAYDVGLAAGPPALYEERRENAVGRQRVEQPAGRPRVMPAAGRVLGVDRQGDPESSLRCHQHRPSPA